MPRAYVPTTDEVLADPVAFHWVKDALRSALTYNPVDMTNDTAFPCVLLDERADATMKVGRAAVTAAVSQVERQVGDKPGCTELEGQDFVLLAGPASLRVARAILPISFPMSLPLAGSIFSFPAFLSLPDFLQPLKSRRADRPALRADRATPGLRVHAHPLRGPLHNLAHPFHLHPPGAGLSA